MALHLPRNACQRQSHAQPFSSPLINFKHSQLNRGSKHQRKPKSCVRCNSLASSSPPLTPTDSIDSTVANAVRNGTLGVGFSAGGLLFSYYVGVMNQLRKEGVLTDATPVAGASAGSLIAVCCKAGLSHERLVQSTLELADECRRLGTRHNLGPVLARTLERVLPDDIHERANQGNVNIAVTRLTPQAKPELINKFTSREDLISAMLTSCHIPWYFNGHLVTRFRDELHVDGGLTNFLPVPEGVTNAVRVCCFPSQQMQRMLGSLCITPDTFEAWPYDTRTMLSWAFEPADDQTLLQLVAKGERDAAAWAHTQGLRAQADALQAARSVDDVVLQGSISTGTTPAV